jgi:hypothetical protein
MPVAGEPAGGFVCFRAGPNHVVGDQLLRVPVFRAGTKMRQSASVMRSAMVGCPSFPRCASAQGALPPVTAGVAAILRTTGQMNEQRRWR